MIVHASNSELLAILTNEEKWLTYRGTLAPLFYPRDSLKGHPRIGAALTLVERLLLENAYSEECMHTPHEVIRYLKLHYRERYQEVFSVMFLDTQNRLILIEDMFYGTLNQTSVYPREVLRKALAIHAATVIFAHNHPSGLAEPSHADELLTQNLKMALALVDIRVLDHLVIAGNSHISMAERGLI
jgi:DNA repair protein RadC